jgi:hypothetical protein
MFGTKLFIETSDMFDCDLMLLTVRRFVGGVLVTLKDDVTPFIDSDMFDCDLMLLTVWRCVGDVKR